MLFPMMYFRENHFYPFLFDWREHSYGHPVAPGLAIYLLDPREGRWTLNDVRAEMHTARKSNIGGMVFYRAKFLNDNHKGIYNTACQEFFPYPALPPRMTWSSDTIPPLPPHGLRCENGILTWHEGEIHQNNGNYTFYNIYGSNVYPVDVSKAENLLQARVCDTHYELTGRSTSRRYFAVCASDRFGKPTSFHRCLEPMLPLGRQRQASGRQDATLEISFRQEIQKAETLIPPTFIIPHALLNHRPQLIEFLGKTNGNDTHIHPQVDFNTRMNFYFSILFAHQHVNPYGAYIPTSERILQQALM